MALSGAGQQEWNEQPFPLNDPVFDGIKNNLIISSRIGLEPLSQKFARIAFFCKRRMWIRLRRIFVSEECPQNSYAKLRVEKDGDDAIDECPFNIPLSEVKVALHSLVRHIRKWNTITFNRATATYFANPMGTEVPATATAHWDALWDGIVNQLLDALLAESPSNRSIDVRKLDFNLCTADQQKMADVVRRSAPNLRCLNIELLSSGGVAQPSTPLYDLGMAIGACQKLLALRLFDARAEQFPPEFVAKLLTLPRLLNLYLGLSPGIEIFADEDGIEHEIVSRTFDNLRSFCIDHDWLQAVMRLPELSLLKNMQHFKVYCESEETVPLAAVWAIVDQMSAPKYVDIDYYSRADISWQNIWAEYLPMTYKTGASIERTLDLGLRTRTDEQFQAGLATMPPIVQNALTVPNLAEAPIKNNRYQKLEFNFSSGAKITFKNCWP